MKKSLFFVALAATMLTGCKKDDSLVNIPQNQNEEENAPIAFNLSYPVSVESVTRGSGAVGDLEGEVTNVWNKQTLNVFMFSKGSLQVATERYAEWDNSLNQTYGEATDYVLFYDAEVTAPGGYFTGEGDYGTETKYYPPVGMYDFFAYHADDADDQNVTGVTPEAKFTQTPARPDEYTVGAVAEDTILTMMVQIDGSQDLMVAKAAPNESDFSPLKDGEDWNDNTNDFPNKVFSAFTARRGIQPTFTFEHLLSRFVFNVTPGLENATGEDGISIDKVTIKNVKNQADMLVAYSNVEETAPATGAVEDYIASNYLKWKQETSQDGEGNTVLGAYYTEDMYLKQRDTENAELHQLEDLESVLLTWDDDADGDGTPDEGKGVQTRIGESLLLPADVASYELEVKYSQRPNAAERGAMKDAAREAAKEDAREAAREAAREVAMLADWDAYCNTNGYGGAEAEAETSPHWAAWVDQWTWSDEGAWTWTEEGTWTWSEEGTWTPTEEQEIYLNRKYEGTLTATLNAAQAAGGEGTFEAGKQYNVNFTIYGLEKIVLKMTLTGWDEGGNLNFDNDDNTANIEVYTEVTSQP